MKKGLVWLGSASAVMRVIELVSTIIIWWFLTKEELGLAALSWSIGVVLEAFNGLGVGTALVQAPELTSVQKHSLFWFSVGLAGILVSAISLGSGYLAAFFGDASLQPLIVVSIVRFLFLAVALVPMQLLIRDMKFKELALTQTIAALTAAAVKITLAALGFGAWALVLAYTMEGFVIFVGVYYFSNYRPGLSFAWKSISGMVVFGFKVAASGILYHVYRNLDYFVLGRFFGTSAVGVYKVGFDIAMLPAQSVLDVINRTAFPVYARIQKNRLRLKETYLWTTRSLGLLVSAIPVFLMFSAHDLLTIIADGRWISAVPVVQILCWAAVLRCLAQATPQLFHAVGKPELAVYDSAVTFTSLAITFFGAAAVFGESMGFIAIAWAWLLSYPLIIFILWLFARTQIPLGWWEFIRSLWAPAASTIVLTLLIAGLNRLLNPLQPLSPWIGLTTRFIVLMTGFLVFIRFVLGIRRSVLFPKVEDEEQR